jgi:hypothetical protein
MFLVEHPFLEAPYSCARYGSGRVAHVRIRPVSVSTKINGADDSSAWEPGRLATNLHHEARRARSHKTWQTGPDAAFPSTTTLTSPDCSLLLLSASPARVTYLIVMVRLLFRTLCFHVHTCGRDPPGRRIANLRASDSATNLRIQRLLAQTRHLPVLSYCRKKSFLRQARLRAPSATLP